MNMNVKKFTAATTRDALRMVRDELGDEAVILSNRKVSEGIEIMAMTNDALSDMTQQHARQDAPQPAQSRPGLAMATAKPNQQKFSQQVLSQSAQLQSKFADVPQLNVKADIGSKNGQSACRHL